jgi:hypothetical protein
MKKRNKDPNNIDLCRSTRRGMVAFSPIFHWMMQNKIKRIPKLVSKPIIVGEFQGLDWPPHCKDRNKQQREAMSAPAPGRSSCFSCFTIVTDCRSSLFIFRKIKIKKKVMAPIGTLLAWSQHLEAESFIQLYLEVVLTSRSTIASWPSG